MQVSWLRRISLSALSTVLLVGCGDDGTLVIDTGDDAATSTTGGSEEPVGEGALFIAANALDFGFADCGGEAPTEQKVVLVNTGKGPVQWAASIDSSVYFTLGGDTEGTLQPGEKATLLVSAASMPSVVEAGSSQQATILISSNASVPTSYIPVKATARGASFEVVAPAIADFGTVPVGGSSPGIPVMLKNVGNGTAKVAVSDPADPQFSFSWGGSPAALEVPAGGALANLKAHFTPTSSASATGSGLIEVTGAVCGTSATSIPVKGQGLAGGVGISPGTLDLGKVGCNTDPVQQTVALYNTGNKLFVWSAKFKGGTNFTLEQASGAIPAGGVFELLINPKKIGNTTNLDDNGFGDTLVITTNIAGDTPHEVPVKQTASGAIYAWDTMGLAFGNQQAFAASAAQNVTVVNSGNVDATLKIEGGSFASAKGVAKAGGGSLVAEVKFTPQNLGPMDKAISIVSDTPVCQPLPAAVPATGSGKGVATQISLNGRGAQRSQGDLGGCIVLKDSAKVACFGQNNFGVLGALNVGTGPVIVGGLPDVAKVARGDNFACALGKDGTVWCWGNNRAQNNNRVGKLGSGTVDASEKPVKVDLVDAVDVGAGHNMACAVLATGKVVCWGTNRRGNLGSGVSGINLNPTPVEVPNLADMKQVNVSGGGACAIRNDETAWCWGRYRRGSNLGNNNGNNDGQSAPVQVSLAAIKQVSGMTNAARLGAHCALYGNGTAACWGGNNWGQLGNGSCGGGSRCRGYYYTPSAVSGISGATQITGMSWGGCVLMADQTVRCWGRNDAGQMGVGNMSQVYSTPQTVTGLTGVVGIGAGSFGACAIKDGGSVKCWGQFGMADTTVATDLRYFTP